MLRVWYIIIQKDGRHDNQRHNNKHSVGLQSKNDHGQQRGDGDGRRYDEESHHVVTVLHDDRHDETIHRVTNHHTPRVARVTMEKC